MFTAIASATEPDLNRWLQKKQDWQRDTDGPIVSLGKPGAFDDTHIFAPMVSLEDDIFRLWYCGSTASVQQRVFKMGLATSRDGRQFAAHGKNPIYGFADGKHSVLTPTLLRNPDGSTIREDGKLRMWFCSTWFEGDQTHTLHQATSKDGVQWSLPSKRQVTGVYAPTIIKENERYLCGTSMCPWRLGSCGMRSRWMESRGR